MYELVIVGAGRMGGAVLTGLLKQQVFPAARIGIYHPNAARREFLANHYGVQPATEKDVAEAKRVLLGVKPQSFSKVQPLVNQPDRLVISIMAGITLRQLAAATGSNHVVRAMPNLGASLGLSATAFAATPEVPPAELATATEIFAAVGQVFPVSESQFDAFTGMAASGVAFAAVVADALGDGGVRVGIDRDMSRELARQVLLATAHLLEEKHPSALKDEVCSAGGTAISGVRTIEQHGLRFALIDAVEAATKQASEMGALDHS